MAYDMKEGGEYLKTRSHRTQLKEAEATGWKRSKVCARFNLCKASRICGQFEEAAEIEKELEVIGAHDPFAMGLSLHCNGNLAHFMADLNKSITANRDAIAKLVNTKISGMLEHLRMSAISEALQQCW